MRKQHVITALGAVSVCSAWWHGHRWRRLQCETPGTVSSHDSVFGADAEVLCVYMGGSFSRASMQAAPLLGAMSYFGDVIASEYNLELYTDEREYEALLSEALVRLASGQYSRVLVCGFSVGAIDALRLVCDLWRRGVNAEPILIDPLLSGLGLKSMDRLAAQVARHARPGPFWNFAAKPLIARLISGRPEEYWEEGQKPEVLRNLADMRSTKLSAYVRFGAKPLKQRAFGPECFVDRRITVVWSGHDPTLHMPGARADVEEVLLLANLRQVVAGKGRHGDFTEQPQMWMDFMSRELEAILT